MYLLIRVSDDRERGRGEFRGVGYIREELNFEHQLSCSEEKIVGKLDGLFWISAPFRSVFALASNLHSSEQVLGRRRHCTWDVDLSITSRVTSFITVTLP